MDKIKLLPHNQEMIYEIEKSMVSGHRKIFYTEATGLGKSYIFMYLVHKYFKDKKVLYICPKYHIWYNMQSYKEFELIKDCVTMMCYADFNKIKDRHLGYDVIFIDEAHHLATPIQGENIIGVADVMLATTPNSYMFGFTATPYIDGEMVGDKYFETSVIGMDLLDAIDRGILQKINYAVAIKDEIILDGEEKKLRQKMNIDTTAQTVVSVVNQYSNINRWLVYFSRISELNENISYFEKHFPDYKLFVIHSDIDDCESIMHEFECYEGKAFLASVSMVLEGVHVKNVEGVLMYRNVYSDNTFLQIIGRLGIIDPSANPIVIDIYGSYNNFINSSIVKSYNTTNDRIIDHGKLRDYLTISSSSYKFIDFASVIYSYYYCEKEYRGIKWKTNVELSRKLGMGVTYVNSYRKKGKSYEEIIDQVLDNRREYRGITWIYDTELSIKLGKPKSYVSRHHNGGKSYEEIIDRVLDSEHEYRGIKWIHDKDLSIKLGMHKDYVTFNRKKGKSYEEIIDYVLDNRREYRGITWTNDRELSIKLGMSGTYVYSYHKKGKSYEEIIDQVLDNRREYRGITWTNDRELTIKLGTYKNYVNQCIHRGKSYEEIIDYILDSEHEYRGIKWIHDKDLSIKLGMHKDYVFIRRKKGKSYEEIIDYVLDNRREYRGITWIYDTELSIKLGMYKKYVTYYLNKGKSYEEIIDHVLDNE